MRKIIIVITVAGSLLLLIANLLLWYFHMLTSDAIGLENIVVQFLVVIAALWAILITFQANERQIQENQRLVIEDRQQQQRPVLAPVGELIKRSVNSALYQTDGILNWNYAFPIPIKIQNVGAGAALNVHCILYGSDYRHDAQFVSWDNGPLGTDITEIHLQHPQQLKLIASDSLDSFHLLYDASPPKQYHASVTYIARLTITYTDLFGKKHMSAYDYTLEHHWVHVVTKEVALDLKEANEQKKVQKHSAPPIQTSL